MTNLMNSGKPRLWKLYEEYVGAAGEFLVTERNRLVDEYNTLDDPLIAERIAVIDALLDTEMVGD